MQVILYANSYADLEALQRYESLGKPVELYSYPMVDESIQVIIDLGEYSITPTENGYNCAPIK